MIRMLRPSHAVLLTAIASLSIALHAASLEPIRENCTIGAGEKAGTLRLHTDNGDCPGRHNCGNNMSDVPASRFSGISLADLANQGAHLTATMAADSGTFVCAGTVTGGELIGNAVFTPDAAFVARMEKIGFTGYDSPKLLAYAYLDVRGDWAQSLKQIGITDLNSDNLIALRVFNIDPAYVHSLTALGYSMPTADQLAALGSQGVNAQEVSEIRALGYQPTFDQLVQIRIFKITPDFIHRMQARGLKDLTLDKLVQIRIFNLAD